MDPHLIYIVSSAKKNKIVWDKVTSDSEWKFIFNPTNEINAELITNNIDSHFIDGELIIVANRESSRQINKKDIDKAIIQFLVSHSTLVWDVNFINAMEFNKIGTMRCGRIKTDK